MATLCEFLTNCTAKFVLSAFYSPAALKACSKSLMMSLRKRHVSTGRRVANESGSPDRLDSYRHSDQFRSHSGGNLLLVRELLVGWRGRSVSSARLGSRQHEMSRE